MKAELYTNLEESVSAIFNEMNLTPYNLVRKKLTSDSFITVSLGITGTYKGYFILNIGINDSKKLATYISSKMDFEVTEDELPEFQIETFSEISNQIAGRLSTKLSEKDGVDSDITPPSVFKGSNISFYPGKEFNSYPLTLQYKDSYMGIMAWLKS